MSIKKASLSSLLASLFLLVFACGNSETTTNTGTAATTTETPTPGQAPDYSALAKAFCQCAQPSITLNAEMAQLQEAGKREEFVAKTEQVGTTFKNAMICAREQKSKLTTAVLNPEETFKAMMNNCPDIPERMADSLSKTVK